MQGATDVNSVRAKRDDYILEKLSKYFEFSYLNTWIVLGFYACASEYNMIGWKDLFELYRFFHFLVAIFVFKHTFETVFLVETYSIFVFKHLVERVFLVETYNHKYHCGDGWSLTMCDSFL